MATVPKIIISGLTAAGKTTHGRLIAESFAVPYVSGSSLLSELAELPGPWTPELDARRSQGIIDMKLDRLMVSKYESSSEGVFDGWALPWLTADDGIRIWIASDNDSRLRKAIVTELRKGHFPDTSSVRQIVESKDRFSRKLFGRLYGFDLYTEHEVFDLILDNSEFIPQATVECSDRGIRDFDGIMMARLRAHLSVPE